MQRVKWAIGIVVAVVVVFFVFSGVAAYLVMRNMSVTPTGESAASSEFDRVRRQFSERPPLVEIGDATRGEIRFNRPPESSPRQRIESLRILAWEVEDQDLVRFEIPLWMLRFSFSNLMAKFGPAFGSFELTAGDLERHGPGIVADFKTPKGDLVLVWAQ